jgi:hypothetical protein
VIDAYHRLLSIERRSECRKATLQARPVYHRKRHSIEAHRTIVFAALTVSHWIETTTRWSIEKFVRTTRRYRTITIQADPHTITAADPSPTISAQPGVQRPTPRSAPQARAAGAHELQRPELPGM